jgi:hypothetical protein
MYKYFYYLLGFLLIYSLNVFGQVTIKEKVNINPEKQLSIPTDIPLDSKAPIYLRYGGDVILYLENAVPGPYALWEDSLGNLEGGSLPLVDSLNLGNFPQWHRFIFYMLDTAGNKLYWFSGKWKIKLFK